MTHCSEFIEALNTIKVFLKEDESIKDPYPIMKALSTLGLAKPLEMLKAERARVIKEIEDKAIKLLENFKIPSEVVLGQYEYALLIDRTLYPGDTYNVDESNKDWTHILFTFTGGEMKLTKAWYHDSCINVLYEELSNKEEL